MSLRDGLFRHSDCMGRRGQRRLAMKLFTAVGKFSGFFLFWLRSSKDRGEKSLKWREGSATIIFVWAPENNKWYLGYLEAVLLVIVLFQPPREKASSIETLSARLMTEGMTQGCLAGSHRFHHFESILLIYMADQMGSQCQTARLPKSKS